MRVAVKRAIDARRIRNAASVEQVVQKVRRIGEILQPAHHRHFDVFALSGFGLEFRITHTLRLDFDSDFAQILLNRLRRHAIPRLADRIPQRNWLAETLFITGFF